MWSRTFSVPQVKLFYFLAPGTARVADFDELSRVVSRRSRSICVWPVGNIRAMRLNYAARRNINSFWSISMNYRRLGEAGVKLSEIGLGVWLTFGNALEAAQA